MRVHYSPDQSVPNAQSYSPSAGKPQLFVEYLTSLGRPVTLVTPPPVTRDDIVRAHAAEYADGVLGCRIKNGFGNTLPEVARSLPYTSGSFLSAARDALTGPDRVVHSPTSGFHHAGWQYGGGFCTFNGLMIAALAIHAERPSLRIAILDCDQHYGDGTEDIADRVDPERSWLITQGHTLSSPEGQRYLDTLEGYVSGTLDHAGLDLVLYQAGADPHVDDPLGGRLTTAQMGKRDTFVFEWAASRGIPVAWNLAGGYQRDANGAIWPVLDLHLQTFDIALAAGVAR